MKIVYGVKSQVRPDEIDDISSETTVFVRENITESVEVDPVFGTKHTIYTYDEKQYTYKEWNKLCFDKIDLLFNDFYIRFEQMNDEIRMLKLTIEDLQK